MQMPFSQQRLFKGAENNTFLAPRGVFIKNKMLFVADTGQNRVFIWKKLPTSVFQAPDVVLGQAAQTDTGRNANGEVSASTLQYPSAIWSDGQRLIVADAWNHRVLIWNELPMKNGQSADVVLGQPNFESNQPNVKGINTPPTAQSLYWCYGVCSDGKSLWIADTGNRRVLYFNEIPTQSFAPADKVIGQRSFTERDYDPQNAAWAYSVKVSQSGQLAITDTQSYRVLLWDSWQEAFCKPANTIIGQSDFSQNGQNQFGFFPKANTLNWCYDTCFYKNGIFVADTGNSRVLWFENLPKENNATADRLIGQKGFETGSENLETILTTENTLYWAFSISVENNLLAIADTGNHRIMLMDLL
ncbi:NHL repeat-containing protein [Thermoflexibacter ruber]|uniref:NHL repeat-containing protein n=1 Tax=Thermoflexibacter ruber TaxID=1003 RepID=A0A1I2B220_9BACT|nr:hypothetical protein [Thermoflexibacter ruber]SFE49313.1 hypothetical protein SAMN04488541_100277 [Thermoflexibacter ruber]